MSQCGYPIFPGVGAHSYDQADKLIFKGFLGNSILKNSSEWLY
jgi:hypothetical protein